MIWRHGQRAADAGANRASRPRGGAWAAIVRALAACGFFAAFYLHLWKVVDLSLIYDGALLKLPSGQSPAVPIFCRGAAFFGEFLDRPGGIVEYAAACLSQFYYYPRFGALLLTGAAAAVFLLGVVLARSLGGTGRGVGLYGPPLFLLVAWNQYTFRLEPALALLAALAFTDAYLALAGRLRHAWAASLAFVACASVLYLIAGGSFLLFVIVVAFSELLLKQRYIFAVLCPAAAMLVPLLAQVCFAVTPVDCYCRLSGLWPWEGGRLSGTAAAADACLLAAAIYLVLRPRIAAPACRFWQPLVRFPPPRGAALSKALAVCLLAAGAGLVAWWTVDREGRDLLRLNYLARHEMWPELLAELDRHPGVEYTPSLLCDVNRALFETGQLPSRMFAYPQRAGALFAAGQEGIYVQGACDVLLRLGCVNQAEHTAQEVQEAYGNRPAILRRLAVINVVKGRPETAAVFLNALRKDVIYGAWAEDWLQRLETDPAMEAEAEVRGIRRVMLDRDFIYNSASTDYVLWSLLARNRKNRMAFEYLMAEYLLSVEPAGVVAQIGRLDDFDYPEIPPLYAEAIALYARQAGRPPGLHGRTLPAAAVRRAAEVAQLVASVQGDEAALRQALAARFPDSVSRYFLTNESGMRLAREWEAWNRPDRAMACYQRAAATAADADPRKTEALARLAWILATHPADAVRNGSRAMQLARDVRDRTGETPEALDLLAAAYAEGCLFRPAVDEARRAEAAARRAGNDAALRRIRRHLDFYLAGQPFRDTFP
jgi:tetratricopeptide (TPR) repeat protein